MGLGVKTGCFSRDTAASRSVCVCVCVCACGAVSCSLATFFNAVSGKCETCPAGTYQDVEGQLSCKPCPHGLLGVGIEAAKSINECGGVVTQRVVFSERELTFTFAICYRPSVCRLSVVCNVRAPY